MKAEELKKSLGNAIRRERHKLGISQEDLAFKCGLHRTYIGSVERGERNISIQNIVRICDVFKISAYELLKNADL